MDLEEFKREHPDDWRDILQRTMPVELRGVKVRVLRLDDDGVIHEEDAQL